MIQHPALKGPLKEAVTWCVPLSISPLTNSVSLQTSPCEAGNIPSLQMSKQRLTCFPIYGALGCTEPLWSPRHYMIWRLDALGCSCIMCKRTYLCGKLSAMSRIP